jgi:hypothetical protein
MTVLREGFSSLLANYFLLLLLFEILLILTWDATQATRESLRIAPGNGYT